jgi:fagellar hook-basal body proteins
MTSQSQSLSVIGSNIANVSTPGFKRSEAAFRTVMSREYASNSALGDGQGPLSSQSDIGGVTTAVLNRITDQGSISATGQPFDLAVSGNGLFVFRQGFATTSGMVFGRNGQLSQAMGAEITITNAAGQPQTVNESYLVNGNGQYLQGWAANADGSFSSDLASLEPVRVDTYGYSSQGQQTTTAALNLNLPAADAIGDSEDFLLGFYNSLGTLQQATATFTKTANNTWDVQVTGQPGDQVALTPAQALTFTSSGLVASPAGYALAVSHADGTTSAFALDVSGSTQFAGPYTARSYDFDGYAPGTLEDITIDSRGYVNGNFSNGQTQRLYRLPLATFANTDGLTPLAGNVYAANDNSGDPVVQGVGEGGTGILIPEALESSNVEMEDQYSRMIQTQQAYNSAATAFRTMDEIIQTSLQLKR